MPLILAPSFDEQTRDQIESHISVLRTKRMSAALEYHEGQRAKIAHETDKIQNKVTRAYETLQRRLATADKAINALEDAAAKCEILRGELGLMLDLQTE